MSKQLVTIAMVAALATPVAAQTLRVRITDEKDRPIWGAKTGWTPMGDTRWRTGLTTDSTGRFAASPVAGQVIVSVYAPGFRHRVDTVVVASRDTVDHRIVLHSDRWTPLYGFHFGAPAAASMAIGPAYMTNAVGSHPPRDQGMVFVFVEPGIRAGRLSAGFFPTMGQMGSGLEARATILQKWKTPTQTFAGAELTVMPFFLMGPRVGLFRRVRGGTGWFVFVDFGFGG